MKKICLNCNEYKRAAYTVEHHHFGSYKSYYKLCTSCFDSLNNEFGKSEIIEAAISLNNSTKDALKTLLKKKRSEA